MDYKQTADHWDNQHFDQDYLRAEWSFHPYAKARLNKLLGFNSREEWFHHRYLAGRSGLRALGIGVGTCETEVNILSLGAIAHYDFYDVSPAALEDGKRRALEKGIADKVGCHCQNIHQVDLEPGSYDVITFIASLHHIEDLEGILAKCYEALAPGGVLWAAEYTGPDRFDYPPEHTDLARRIYRALDPSLKKSWEPELRFPTVHEVIEADPTESVHSSRIIDVAGRIFDDLEILPTYGTFAFILSWSLNHDALYDTPQGREFFQTVLDLDQALIDSGQLPHYFAYLIGRKPGRVRSAVGRFSTALKCLFGKG